MRIEVVEIVQKGRWRPKEPATRGSTNNQSEKRSLAAASRDLKMAQDAMDLRLTFNLFYIETISSN
jgi:hypothetical protein